MKLPSVPMLVSIAVAGIGFTLAPASLFFLRSNTNAMIFALNANIWLAWLWPFTFLLAIYTDRWRSLWLLVAAPFALAWPIWVVVFGSIRHRYGGCVLDG